jgi:ribonuclease Y
MNSWGYVVYTSLIAFGLVGLGFAWSFYVHRVDNRRAREDAERLLETARGQADLIRQSAEATVANRLNEERVRLEAEITREREEWRALARETLDRQARLQERESSLDARQQRLERRDESLDERERRVQTAEADQARRSEEIAGLSAEAARAQVLAAARASAEAEAQQTAAVLRREAERRVEEDSRRLLVLAIERNAAAVTAETTTSTVTLPTEEMKGRLIGKEGRNIKSFESVSGVDLLVDDSPGQVVLSAADPVRREVARIALTRLIADGRIHPGRIEEAVEQARREVDEHMRRAAEDAVAQLSLAPLAPAVLAWVGRLAFRGSHGQNVLAHSLEMAAILATLAGELGLDIQIAKRVGLLHDLGKAFSHEREGSHATVGAALLEQHGEPPEVVNAVAAHHGEVPPTSLYAHLCVAADAITASRPGARRENLAEYLRRIESLESLANSRPGVRSSFAIHAGRELRVLVNPEEIDDTAAQALARDLAGRIRAAADHPGPIRVTVVRETRAVEIVR